MNNNENLGCWECTHAIDDGKCWTCEATGDIVAGAGSTERINVVKQRGMNCPGFVQKVHEINVWEATRCCLDEKKKCNGCWNC